MKNIGFFFAIFLFSCTKKEEPKDKVEIRSFTNVDTYIEKDSTTLFFGKETLKLMTFDTNTVYTYAATGTIRQICTGSVLEVENLTDKNVKIVFYRGGGFEWARTEITAKQKAKERFNLCEPFYCSLSGCPGIQTVIGGMKVTYN